MTPRLACDVWWARPRPVLTAFRDVLSAPEKGRLAAYRDQAAALRFLTGRLLLRAVLGAMLDAPARAVPLDATCGRCGAPHGKPRLAMARPPAEASLAHAGDRVAVAVTHSAAVGVDVEPVNRPRTGPAVLAAALAERERAAVSSLPEPRQPWALMTYWTRKEAVLKAAGLGLTTDPATVAVAAPTEPPRLVTSVGVPAAHSVTLRDLRLGGRHVAALAVLAADPVRVTERWWPLPGATTDDAPALEDEPGFGLRSPELHS